MKDNQVSIHRMVHSGRVPEPTRNRPIIVSASELAGFLRCRLKWDWSWRQQLQPIAPSEALAMGSLVHKGIEHYYTLPPVRTVKHMQKVAPKLCRSYTEKQVTTENRQLAEAMLIGYAAWAQDEDKEYGLKECTPERPFLLPLNEDRTIWVRGFIDVVFESTVRRKTVSCCEFKTRSQFRDDNVEMLLQASVYLWALRQLYPKHKYFTLHYRELRKQMPSPRVHAPLFQSQEVERGEDEIEQWARDTAAIAWDMLDPAIYPHPMGNCQFDCDFRNACLARGNQADLEHILSTEYTTRTKEK